MCGGGRGKGRMINYLRWQRVFSYHFVASWPCRGLSSGTQGTFKAGVPLHVHMSYVMGGVLAPNDNGTYFHPPPWAPQSALPPLSPPSYWTPVTAACPQK